MKKWIIPSKNNNLSYPRGKYNFEIKDIIYIYNPTPEKRIVYKCIVDKIAEENIELKVIFQYKESVLTSLSMLKDLGIKTIKIPIQISDGVAEYLDMVIKLQKR